MAHLVAEAVEAAQLVEQAAAPEQTSASLRHLVPVGAELQARIGAMVGEISLDDAVLQHAAEGEREAARGPGQAPGDQSIGGEHQRGAEHERRAARAEPREGMRLRSTSPTEAAAAMSAEQHGERRAVGSGGDGDQRMRPMRSRGQACRRAAAADKAPARRARQKMSVSRMAVSQGRVVSSESAAMTPSRSSGRRPSPCARSVSASTQTVTARLHDQHRPEIRRTPGHQHAGHRPPSG